MASDLKKRAEDAFLDDNLQLAHDLYSQAIGMDPNNADLYVDRAQANIKLGRFDEAVADANKAVELDPSRPKAYLRKGTACIKLEDFQTAKGALETGCTFAPGDSRFTKLIEECDKHIAEETNELLKNIMSDPPASSVSPSLDTAARNSKDSEPMQDLQFQSIPAAQSKPKYKHDYYNATTEVVLSIYARGIPAEYVTVAFGEQTLSVSIDVPSEDAYHFQPRLFGKIIPGKSRYEVLSSKIEIRLAKAETITWTSLEFSRERAIPQKSNVPSASKSQKPSYPSSKGNTDWNKLESQMKKEEKEEKLEGDAALNKLFREIYQDADDDMRRAMAKSFVESNGTVLSTNWKDVGSKKVEGSPPDGMELKKWEY